MLLQQYNKQSLNIYIYKDMHISFVLLRFKINSLVLFYIRLFDS